MGWADYIEPLSATVSTRFSNQEKSQCSALNEEAKGSVLI